MVEAGSVLTHDTGKAAQSPDNYRSSGMVWSLSCYTVKCSTVRTTKVEIMDTSRPMPGTIRFRPRAGCAAHSIVPTNPLSANNSLSVTGEGGKVVKALCVREGLNHYNTFSLCAKGKSNDDHNFSKDCFWKHDRRKFGARSKTSR